MDLNSIDLLGLDRVLRRGTGVIIEEKEDMLFLYDTVSEAYFLACDDPDLGLSVLERYKDLQYRLLMTSDPETGLRAFEKYGYTEKLECHQITYYGDMPAADDRISIRTASEDDLPFLFETYHMLSADDMKKVVDRGCIWLGYAEGRLAGFIGEHLEGAMGLLYIFPEYRRKGYASALENYYIRETMKKGMVPFCQVETDNQASLKLQRSIGMTVSENIISWMW